jgi:hypothetical protein
MEKIHSWHTGGGGSSLVTLAAGAYTLVSTREAPRYRDPAEPPSSTENDPGLTVTDAAGTVIQQAAGEFTVVKDGSFGITFGPTPKVVELWSVEAATATKAG